VNCPRCMTSNPESGLFCCRCKAILEPRTEYWLGVDDFQCSADKDALEVLKSTGVLAYIVDQFLVRPFERKQREYLSRHGFPSSHLGYLERIVKECAYTLCLGALPEVYVADFRGTPNAFTFGNDSAPVVVVDSGLIQILTHDELRALLGHEMGHIKSKHLLYHSLANVLAEGVGLSSSFLGSNLITAAMKLALLAWHRESEFTADRAALISSEDPKHVASMFAKILGVRHISISSDSSLLQELAEIFQSHPNHLDRIKAVIDFSKSQDYSAILKKISHRRMFRAAFTTNCRFCGASKPSGSSFCPECGKSQV